MYNRKSLQTFIDDLAAKRPVPGGGSASAAVAAIALALGSMQARFTVDNPQYSSVAETFISLLIESERLRKECLQYVDKDVVAYGTLNKVLRMPSANKQRAQLLQKHLVRAAEVPFELCVICDKAMKICEELAKKGNVNLITDAGCGALLLESAFAAAALNVRINLKYVKDKKFVDAKCKTLRKMAGTIAVRKKKVLSCVEKAL
ncbi:MAG: cyclodeaminase/cyclohydrolase family protein [Candidatus Omnitrophica bacterium]|nr:cyclodeaminase/cyclohydrolase family protein [Candidatus Omnitrophota bacterium]